jgi:integrase
MPRQAKLRKKKVGSSVYWFTKAGGETYFGSVDAVSYSEARKLFNDHVKILAENEVANHSKGLTAGDLIALFLAWVEEKRSRQTFTTRKLYCTRFANFEVSPGRRVADLPANKMRGQDLESWLAALKKEHRLGAQTLLHAETSVRHCWTWATKHPSPTPYLPPTYRPFAGVERTHVPLKVLNENDLIKLKEVEAVFAAAEMDLDQFRRFGLEDTLERNGVEGCRRAEVYSNFADMLRCYYHTGARTGELASCTVGDVLERTRQVVLGKHKRSQTQKTPTVRHITLNDEAFALFRRNCEGKDLSERVFLNSDGLPWTARGAAKRFERVKEVAAKMKLGKVRKAISIYDFRHLWISEMLMAGNDVATVARMAGTSIAMIERVYGHFRNDHLQEAQNRLDVARKKRAAQS